MPPNPNPNVQECNDNEQTFDNLPAGDGGLTCDEKKRTLLVSFTDFDENCFYPGKVHIDVELENDNAELCNNGDTICIKYQKHH